MWQQSGKSMGSRVGLLFYLFCFVLNMGEITAYLYAGGNSPVEEKKTFDKTEYPFVIKNSQRTKNKENFFNLWMWCLLMSLNLLQTNYKIYYKKITKNLIGGLMNLQ